MTTTRPSHEIIGTGHRAIALASSLKDRLLEQGFDPAKLMADEAALLKALPNVEREQSVQEQAWHVAVEKTVDTKNLAATKAACLCDMVISAFTRNSPEGEDAMGVRSGLYAGPERREPAPSEASATPAAADTSASPVAAAVNGTPRSAAPDAAPAVSA